MIISILAKNAPYLSHFCCFIYSKIIRYIYKMIQKKCFSTKSAQSTHQTLRSSLRRYLTALPAMLLSISLVSCSDFNPKPRSSPDTPSTPPLEAYPDILGNLDFFLEDSSCLQQEADVSLDSALYNSWDGQHMRRKRLQNPQIQGSPVLSSTLIKRTFLPRTFDIQCRDAPGVSSCDFVGNKPIVPFKLCRNSGSYDAQSLESVALTSLIHLEKAHLFYKRTNPSHHQVERSQLFILPRFTTTHLSAADGQVTHKNTVHDNLSYIKNFYENPAFIIHPPSRSSAHSHKEKLWEYPWTLAHEFAHHVLSSHSKFSNSDLAQQRGVAASSQLSMQPPQLTSHGWVQNYLWGWQNSVRISTHVMKKSKSWNTFNEAYADLWAFFATENNSQGITNIDCLQGNRDASYEKFKDGTFKIITAEALSSFHASSKVLHTSCHQAHFSAVHVFGTALAHGFYRAHLHYSHPHHANAQMIHLAEHLSQILKNPHFNFDIEELTALTIQHLLHSPDKGTFPPFLSQPLAAHPELCADLQQHFPAMLPYWTQRNFFSCNWS